MDITKHAKERYVERIKGIADKQEAKRYLVKEDERITKDILKIYEFSDFIYRGQIGGDKTTADYRLNGDICLVTDEHCIRTIYRINFAFPEQTRLNVIKDLRKVIQELGEQTQDEEAEISRKDSETDITINRLESEIKAHYEEIDIKKSQIEMHRSIKKANRGDLKRLNSTLRIYAEQLFGNTQLKQDIC